MFPHFLLYLATLISVLVVSLGLALLDEDRRTRCAAAMGRLRLHLASLVGGGRQDDALVGGGRQDDARRIERLEELLERIARRVDALAGSAVSVVMESAGARGSTGGAFAYPAPPPPLPTAQSGPPLDLGVGSMEEPSAAGTGLNAAGVGARTSGAPDGLWRTGSPTRGFGPALGDADLGSQGPQALPAPQNSFGWQSTSSTWERSLWLLQRRLDLGWQKEMVGRLVIVWWIYLWGEGADQRRAREARGRVCEGADQRRARGARGALARGQPHQGPRPDAGQCRLGL